MFYWCFIYFYIFSDFCQTNYLDICQTDLREICRIGRTLDVDGGSEVIFFDPSRDVAVATNFVGKIDLQSTPCVVRMIFARAAPPAYDKKGNCCSGRRQTNYLPDSWTQENQLNNKLIIINGRKRDSRIVLQSGFALHLVYVGRKFLIR